MALDHPIFLINFYHLVPPLRGATDPHAPTHEVCDAPHATPSITRPPPAKQYANITKFLRSGSRHRPRVRSYRAFSGAPTDIRRRFAAPQYRYYLFRMWSHIIVGLRRRPSQRSPPGSAPAIVGAQARSRATCSRRGQRYSP